MTAKTPCTRDTLQGSGLRPRAGRQSATRCAVLTTVLSIACAGGTTPGKTATPAGGVSPLPRSVQVDQDTVVVEGRWVPIETGRESPVLPLGVRLRCTRAVRSCQEDLTLPSRERAEVPVQEVFQYRIAEWTKWGTAAGKLVATRREGATQVEIRVSLSGLTAERVVIEKGLETRWRIE